MRTVTVLLVLGTLVAAGGADQAEALLAKGQLERAEKAARTLVGKDPANADAWLVLADALIRRGVPEDAWTELESAIEKNPEDARLSAKLGDAFLKIAEKEQKAGASGTTITSRYLDADRMFDEAIAKDPEFADAWYGKAFANFWLGREETKAEARKALAECLRLDGEHGKAHALQAYMLYLDGTNTKDQQSRLAKFQAAQQKYETALKLDDSDPVDHLRYGHACFAQGKYDAAKAAYLNGLKRHPGYDILIRSGLFNLARQEKRPAADYLKEAVKIAPRSAVSWYYLGYEHFRTEDLDAAREAFAKAASLDDANAVYPFYLGYTHEKAGDERKALAQYRKALSLAPDYADATKRFYEIVIAKAANIDEAQKLFDELIELAPNTGWVFNNYALLLRNWAERTRQHKRKNPSPPVRKRLKRSAELYEVAARLEPNDAQFQSDTGLLFEFYPCIEDLDKAKRYFTRSLDISEGTYRDAFDGLTRACRRSGDWETLKEYADLVVYALEDQGKHAVAPVGASAPRALPNETPGLLARAKAAYALAQRNLGDG